MATLYTITYTYNKTTSWDGSSNTERSVNWADFTASGDTDKRIGRIVGIKYTHSHAAGSGREYSLQGRLLFSDATWLDSSVTTKTIGTSSVVFTNEWVDFPTKSQFESISKVQTIIEGGSAAPDSNLTWAVNEYNPMTVVVEFYEASTLFYGADGAWKECEVYYGVDGAWKQVTPHYGADGAWKST